MNELLSHYLSPERLEGENQYHCDRCGKLQDGERTIGIIDSPRYLILTLLRFAYDTKLQTRSKVDCRSLKKKKKFAHFRRDLLVVVVFVFLCFFLFVCFLFFFWGGGFKNLLIVAVFSSMNNYCIGPMMTMQNEVTLKLGCGCLIGIVPFCTCFCILHCKHPGFWHWCDGGGLHSVATGVLTTEFAILQLPLATRR